MIVEICLIVNLRMAYFSTQILTGKKGNVAALITYEQYHGDGNHGRVQNTPHCQAGEEQVCRHAMHAFWFSSCSVIQLPGAFLSGL